MNINTLCLWIAVSTSIMSTTVFAHGGFFDDLNTSPSDATDIVLYRCPSQAGITLARAKIQDLSTINVTTTMKVQIAAGTATTCPGRSDAAWNTLAASTSPAGSDATSPWAPTWTGSLTASPSSYYCLKVTRASGTAKDDYQIDHHCLISIGAAHSASTKVAITPNPIIDE